MPNIPQSELPKPKSWDEFEDIVWDLYKRAWNDPNAQRYGRTGQAQQGVDIYGQPPQLQGRYAGVQCKRYEPGKLTRSVIEAEIAKAETFDPPLAEYTIATTHPRDATMQRAIRDINEDRAEKGPFPVRIEFWEDICNLLTHPDNRDLLQKHFGELLHPDLAARSTLSAEERQQGEREYLEQVVRDCRYLDSEGVDRVRAELTGVFVMLEAVETPSPEGRTDVAPISGRGEEMGLLERLTGRREEALKAAEPPPTVPLAGALGEHEHLVILGEPGTGKSTTLQFVALCLAKAGEGWPKDRLEMDEDWIPVRVELRQYDGQQRLDRFLVRWLDRRTFVREAVAQEWLEEGRLALLLDGLDEVPQEHRSNVVDAIKDFATSATGKACRIVITSRIAGYRGVRELGSDFGHYTIRPFAGPEDALPYAAGWLKQLRGMADEEARVEAQALLGEMESRDGLRKVRSNPLLLRLIIASHTEGGELARNRAEVYRRYVEEVVWERVRSPEQHRWSREVIERAAETIAWTLQNYGEQTEGDLALAVAKEEVSDARDLLRYLRERLGLLAAYGYEEGEQIAFRHLTFREYFVARRLAQTWEEKECQERVWRFLRPRLHHPVWREPILLLGGALKEADATELVKRVARARSPYGWELNRDLLLAAGIVSDRASVADETATQVADDLAHLLLDRESKWWHRLLLPGGIWILLVGSLLFYSSAPGFLIPLATLIWWATWWLGARKGLLPNLQSMLAFPGRMSGRCRFTHLRENFVRVLIGMPANLQMRSVEPLVGDLANADIDVRWRAAWALSKIGKPAVESLIGALEDGDSRVRKAAAQALGKVGDARAVVPLVEALGDEDRDVRSRAAQALGQTGDARTVEFLIRALGDGDSGVRWWAADLLGRIGDAEALEPLGRALGDEDGSVRQAAANALALIGNARAVELLVETLGDGDSEVRLRAAWALGRIGDARTAEPLIEALGDGDSRVRTAAAQALWTIGDARAVVPLVEALVDEDSHVRQAITETLGKLGDARAVGPLVEALGDGDSGVRRRAADALARIGEAALEPLLQALEDGDSHVRQATTETLGKLGDARAVEPLAGALGDGDRCVRQAAAEALGKIGDARAVEPLVGALEDGGRSVRWSAAVALGTIGDAQAVGPLIEALGDGDSYVRWSAAVALGKIGDARAVGPLVEALGDGDSGVRRRAADALARIGEAALEPLLQALEDGDSHVRQATTKTLGKLGDARAVEPLAGALGDGDRCVRQAAAEALGKIGDARAVEPLVGALEDGDRSVRWSAAVALGTLIEHEKNTPRLRSVARRLWWRLTDTDGVANAAHLALDRTVGWLTELEVEALGGEPDPFTPIPAKAGPSPALLIALSVLVAAVLGIASNVLATYLQEQYRLITDPARYLIVVAVFLIMLFASIWIALRLNKGTAGAA